MKQRGCQVKWKTVSPRLVTYVAAARAVLETLAEQGSPALQADLEPVLAQLNGFVGHTPAEIWTALEEEGAQ